MFDFKINEDNLLKQYIKIYKRDIDPNESEAEITSHDKLNEKIKEYYYNEFEGDNLKYINKKIRLMNKINNCEKNDNIPRIGLLFSVFIPVILLMADKLFEINKDFGAKYLLNMSIVYIVFIAVIAANDIIRTNKILVYKAFNNLCLNILIEYEVEIKDYK
ncbi:hypothetical protein [Clostridium sp. JNZ J1-5]